MPWRKTAVLFIMVTALLGGKRDHVDLVMPPAISALRVGVESIHIDGLLDDPAWQQAEYASEFIQRDPLEGEAATERTEFAVLYDDQYIYIGVKAYDSDPEGIRSLLSRRDEETPSDWVLVSFDSYNDHRTAFEFWLNPQGVKRDIRRYDDDNRDINWDAIWEGMATVHHDGWDAEFRIPFRELRFSNGKNQSWGLQVYRHISRKNEDAFWAFWPKEESGWVRHYGRLNNLTNIPRQRRIYVAPYVTSQYAASELYVTPVDSAGYKIGQNLGADVKVGVTNNFTLDLTLNPDFGQVEADPAELNITAFETYFPEKRPFFVEGGNIYQYSLGTGDNPMASNSLFYTRRVGRRPQHWPDYEDSYFDMPAATSILAAGKLSGKTGGGWSIGVMEAVTAQEQTIIEFEDQPAIVETVEPLTNYFVTRVQKDFREGKTTIGAIATAANRRLDQPYLQTFHSDAYGTGFDFSHIFGEDTYQFSTKLGVTNIQGTREAILQTQLSPYRGFQRPGAPHLKVDSSTTQLSGFAGNMVLSRIRGEHFRGAIGGWFYSPGFDANDMGFNRNVDNSTQFIWFQAREDDPGKIIRRLSVNFNAWTGFTFAGLDEMTNLGGNISGGMTFMNYWSLFGGYNVNARGLNTTGLWGGPAMTEDPSRSLWLYLESDSRKALSGSVNPGMGGVPESGSYWRNLSGSLTWRPTNYFSLTASSSWNNRYDTWSTWGDFGPVEDAKTGELRYIMATMDRNTVAATIRFDLTLTPNLTIQYYGNPLVTAGAYSDDKLVLIGKYQAEHFKDRFHTFTKEETSYDPETETYYYDYDGEGIHDGTANFELGNRDFNYKQFSSNLVVRWEYQTGSAIYLVWSQLMSESLEIGDFELARDLRRLFKADVENVFLIKASYLLNI